MFYTDIHLFLFVVINVKPPPNCKKVPSGTKNTNTECGTVTAYDVDPA